VPGSLELEGDLLVWKFAQGSAYRMSRGILNDFVELWKGTPEDETIRPVADSADTPTQANTKHEEYRKTLEARLPAARGRTLRFARKYGLLGFDRDPIRQLEAFVSDGRAARGNRGALSQVANLAFQFDPEGAEPLRTWWEVSRKACAFLNIAAALKLGRLGDSADWVVIHPHLGPEVFRRPFLGVGAARFWLGAELDRWIVRARIRPCLTWKEDVPVFSWQLGMKLPRPGPLFSQLVLQLLLTIGNADSLYFCSGCGLLYGRPKGYKKPNSGEANFCPVCGREEALRQANRRLHKKRIEARRLNANGFSVKEIAQRLDTTPESVGNWLKKGK
jgi:hypothetical protein